MQTQYGIISLGAKPKEGRQHESKQNKKHDGKVGCHSGAAEQRGKEAGARLWQDMRIGKELPRNKNGIEKVILLSNKTL